MRKATPILLVVMVLVICGQYALSHAHRASPADLKIYVAVQRLSATGPTPFKPGHEPYMQVVLENVSSTPQPILDEWSSYGYFNLKLEFTYPDGTKKLMHKNDRVAWTRNFPSTTTLQPGEVMVRNIIFDPKIWDDIPTDWAGFKVKAIFSQDLKFEPWMKAPVWQGTVESPLVGPL